MSFFLLGVPFAQWRTLPVGAGGFNQGLSIGTDDTLMVRTDTYGAYRWDPAGISPTGTTGTWTQLITALSMPSDYVNGAVGQASQGCYEIQMCYSTPSVVYMMFGDVDATNSGNSTVFKSINSGNTWTRTGFTSIPGSNAPPNDGNWKHHGPKICIKPSDPTHLFVGTQGSGLFKSTDGGATWSLVSTSLIPNPTSGGFSGMCWSRSNPSNIYIFSHGNGTYFSNDGGTTWTKLTAGTGPTDIFWADIDENTGAYWAVDYGTGALWKWNGTIWSNPITGSAADSSVIVDPTTANHILFRSHDTLFESTNGTSFGSASGTNTYTFDTGDIPWISNSQVFGFGSAGAAYMDRSGSNKIYGVFNFGSHEATWTGSVAGNPITHSVRSRGIEQMVGLEVIVPPGGNPVPTMWDNGLFNKPYPVNTSFGTSEVFPAAAWSGDYSGTTPSFLVMIGDGQYEGGSSQAMVSSDGGNNWSSIQSTMPISQSGGACVAVSTSTNFIFGDGHTRQPYFTTNGGTSWTAITLPGSPNFTSPQFGGFQGRGKWIVADKVNSGNFALLYQSLGFYTTTNGGTSFSGPFNATVATTINGGDSIMKSVPGQAGHVFYCDPVANGAGGAGGNNYFGYTANMYGGASQAWTQITNVSYAQNFGFGAAAPGNSYPTIYYTGYSKFACSNGVSIGIGTKTFNLTGSPGHTILPGTPIWMASNGNGDMRGSVVSYSGGVLTVNIDTVIDGSGGPFSNWQAQIYGTWQTTGNTVPGATPAWVQLVGFANNSLDICQGVSGDPNIYGRVYLSFGGSSFAYYG